MDVEREFDLHDDEYLKFSRIESPPSQRPDICALLLIDKLLPKPGRDVISAAEHDVFYLAADIEKFSEVATVDDVIYLVRCGVHYDAESESLAMFV